MDLRDVFVSYGMDRLHSNEFRFTVYSWSDISADTATSDVLTNSRQAPPSNVVPYYPGPRVTSFCSLRSRRAVLILVPTLCQDKALVGFCLLK